MLRSSFCRKVAYELGRTPTPEFLSRRAHAAKGGVNQVLWAEQFWNGHPRKLDREMLEVCPSAKIRPLENFPLYGITVFPYKLSVWLSVTAVSSAPKASRVVMYTMSNHTSIAMQSDN